MTAAPPALAGLVPPDLYAFARRSAITLRTAVLGGGVGRHRARHTGHGVDFFDHRAYVPGDDPRRLDWRAIGRRDRLVVRRTEAERSIVLVLLIDASGGMAYGGPEGPTKYEAAAALACALSILAVRGGDRCIVHVGAEGRVTTPLVRPRGGMGAVVDLAAALGAVEPGGTCPWPELLAAGRRSHGPGTHVVVACSDLLDPGAGAADPDAAEDLVWRGLGRLALTRPTLALRILHRDEIEFPFDDDAIRFVDARGVRPAVDADPLAVRGAYLEAFGRHRARLQERAREHGVHLSEARLPGPLLPPLRRALARLAGTRDGTAAEVRP